METVRADVAIIGAGGAGPGRTVRWQCYDLDVSADALVATIVYAGALTGTAASVLYLTRI